MVRPIMKDQLFLSMKSSPADEQDLEIARDLLDTLSANAEGCVGMAANMIGVAKRIIVVDDKTGENGEPGPNPMYMVNPEIIFRSEEMVDSNEGCLSVPGQSATVERHERVTVKYLDYNGNEQILEADGFLAIILQHETDHLDGVLYIDRISRLKRNMIIKKLAKA
jgi:peptide deformylase